MKYIYHHLGLGDHIICNGIVRHFKNVYEEVTVFSKKNNFSNVEYMYRDDENIHVLAIGEDSDVNHFINENKINDDVIKVGFGSLSWGSIKTFDEEFYSSINLPFDFRFSKFKFVRDIEKENHVYEKINPQGEEYIFLHGNIDRKKIRTDLKIIENPSEFGIFDILKLVDNATEVHIMESSIKCLVNSFVFDKPLFFYHQYVRKYGEYLNSKGKNKFKTIY